MSTTTLESDPAPVAERVCGTCKHFAPWIHPKTNRVHPSKPGRCGWEPNLIWPMAFRSGGYGGDKEPILPYAVPVFKHTPAQTCACWAKI